MTIPASPFGTKLRQWRRHRGLSQLGLAGRVGSTGRHISFLKTVTRPATSTDVRRRGERSV
jgi:transcriptional regulator with XRE-family HTH domain